MEEKSIMEVMYFHGKTLDGYRFTVAGLIENSTCYMGISLCSKLDNFSKAKGRSIATTRLLSEKNPKNFGRLKTELRSVIANNPSKTFSSNVADLNEMDRKMIQKTFNLYHHESKTTF